MSFLRCYDRECTHLLPLEVDVLNLKTRNPLICTANKIVYTLGYVNIRILKIVNGQNVQLIGSSMQL